MAEEQGIDIYRNALDKLGVQINQIPLKHTAISPIFFSFYLCFFLSPLQSALQPGWTQLMQQGFKGIWCLHCISSCCCGQDPHCQLSMAKIPAVHLAELPQTPGGGCLQEAGTLLGRMSQSWQVAMGDP